jgi:hypothetical protein
MSTSQRNTSSPFRWLTYRGQNSPHIRKTHQDGTVKAPRAGVLGKWGQVFISSIPSVATPSFHNRFKTPYIDGIKSKGANLCRVVTRLLRRQSCTIYNLAASFGSIHWQSSLVRHSQWPCLFSEPGWRLSTCWLRRSKHCKQFQTVSSGDSNSG